MNTKIISLLTILALNFSISFANSKVSDAEIKSAVHTNINLAPVTPTEAEFNDLVSEANASTTILMPVTPVEATFDDESIMEPINNKESLLDSLSPTTPVAADFEDPI